MLALNSQLEALLESHLFWESLIALGGVIVATLGLKAVLYFILRRLEKWAARTSSCWDDVAVYAFCGTKTWAIFVWLAIPVLPLLKFHPSVFTAGKHIAIVVTATQVLIWGLRAIGRWRKNFLEREMDQDRSSVAAIGLLGTALQATLTVVVLLLTLSNLGIDVGALMAGLGIGGVAVALAAQNILGDLLASLSIVLDKPFIVGDFIVVGDKSGTVSHIGVKTTRLTALSGEQLVFSNKNLLESQIQNFKRMRERRAVIRIGVTYSTPRDKIELIPQWIKAFVTEDPGLRFDRCHFSGFGGSSLDFELVFFVLSPEYNNFMDSQQALLLKVYDKFSENKVDFAFPSTSVYIEKMPANEVGAL